MWALAICPRNPWPSVKLIYIVDPPMLGVITCVLAVVCKAVQIFATIQEDAEQWGIQGRPNWGPKDRKKFFESKPPASPRVWMTGPSPPPPSPKDCYSVILLYSTYFNYLSFHVWLYSHVFNFFFFFGYSSGPPLISALLQGQILYKYRRTDATTPNNVKNCSASWEGCNQ